MIAFLAALAREVLEWIASRMERGNVANDAKTDRARMRRIGDRIGERLRKDRARRGG